MRSKAVLSSNESVSRALWRETFHVFRNAWVMLESSTCLSVHAWAFEFWKVVRSQITRTLYVPWEFGPFLGCRGWIWVVFSRFFMIWYLLPFSRPFPLNSLCFSNTKIFAHRPQHCTNCLYTTVTLEGWASSNIMMPPVSHFVSLLVLLSLLGLSLNPSGWAFLQAIIHPVGQVSPPPESLPEFLNSQPVIKIHMWWVLTMCQAFSCLLWAYLINPYNPIK